MTSIDLDQLATVTGGFGRCQMQQQQPQQQDAQQQAPDAGAQQGGNMLGGIDQFLSFFQSDSFQQLLGGLRGLVGQLGGAQQASQQQAPMQQEG